MSERRRELFEAVIQDPSNREASDALEQLLLEHEEWTDLANLQVHLAEHAADPAEASARLQRAGEIAESHLGDAQRAVELYGASLEGDPTGGLSTLGRMRTLLVGMEAWEDYLQVGEAEAERTEDGAARAALLTEMGGILESRLGDAERAVICYQAALESDPAAMAAAHAAQRICRDAGAHEMLAQLLDFELERTEDPERRAALLEELGNLLLNQLDQPEMAQVAFSSLLEIRPEDVGARAILESLGGAEMAEEPTEAEPEPTEAEPEAAEAEPEAAEAEPEAAEAEPEAAEAEPEAAEAEPEAAEAEPEAAEPEVAEAAPEAEEAEPEAVEAEPEAVEAEPEAVEAEPEAAEVEPTEAEAEAAEADVEQPAPEPVVEAPEDVAERLAELQAAAAEADEDGRLPLLIEAARLAAQAGGVGPLAAIYLEAATLAPTDVTLYWKVGATLADAPEGVRSAIHEGLEAAAAGAEPEYQPALTAHHLLFTATAMGEPKGVDFKLRDLARKSGDPAVEDWQVQRLIETGKWRNVQQILAGRAGEAPAEARVVALREMAQLAEERADDVAKAADFWRQVHQTDRTDVVARQALVRLYPQVEKWKEYADVLALEVEAIPADDAEAKVAGLRKLIAVHTEHLRADKKVVDFYEQLHALDPDDEGAIEVLAEKYEGMRKWPNLVQLLQQQAERADGEARIAVLGRIAHLYAEKLRNQAEAITAFEAVLAEDPDNADALKALDGMYEKRRDWDHLVEIRRKRADMAEAPEAQLAAYKDLAEYATKKIRRPNICLALWEQVRDIAPGDKDALGALVGFYEQDKNWEALTEAIDELVEQEADDKARADLLQKAGIVLQERISDQPRAVEVWKRLLAIDPNHRRAGDSLKKALIELGEWDELQAFFGERERWDELVRILEGQVGVQDDDTVKIDLLFRSASIWRDEIGQQDRAVRSLERVLQIEPENLAGARALEPIYEENKDYRKLAGVLEVLLNHEEEPSERRTLMLRSAQLNEQHLRNVDGAFEWTRRVVEEHPGDADAHAELERLGGLTQSWGTVHDELVGALGRIQMGEGEADGEAAQLKLLLSLARILDVEMGALEDALGRYHEALDLDPENTEALDAVEALYTRMANWPELLGILDRKLAVAEDTAERKALLRKQGTIFEEQLDDAGSAVERYRSIVEEDEGDLEALEALHRLYEQGEQYEELHDVLQRELQLATLGEGGDPVALKMAIGQIDLMQLGRVAEAVEQFRDILDSDPEHAGARAALEGLLDDPDHRASAAVILEPIYQAHRDWEALARGLEIRLEETEEVERRVELLERIGTLHVERTADIARAFDGFARMLRETPDSRIALQKLTELADAGDGWAALANLLEEVIPDVSDDALGQGLLGRLAEIYEARLGDVDQAIDAHQRVLNLAPEDQASIEALDRLYQRSQQWPELLGIYRRKLELLGEEADGREPLQFQIAELLENMLGDAHEAIQTYQEILEASPENGRALEAVARLYTQEEMWAELADALNRQLELATDEAEQNALRTRLGLLREQQLGNVELAIETYRAVLDADPTNAQVIDALERLIHEPDQRAAVADMLEPIYERQDEWQKLVEVFEIQREEAVDGHRKVELLHRIAGLHQDRGGDAAEAFRTYARAFEVDPGDERTIGHMHRIAEALELWSELVDVYRGQVYDIGDMAVATAVHKRVAKVLLAQLGDVEGARGHYEAAYENDDTDLEVIEALDEIYKQTAQWHELVAVLQRKSELTEATQGKKDLFFQISAIYEDMLGDQERAVESFLAVLEVDEVDPNALDALERIYMSLERWEDLLEVLQKKASLQTELSAKKDIYYVIGQAYEQELDDLQRAVETYQQVLAWDDADQRSLDALDALYQRMESWDDLLKVLARRVETAADGDAQLGLRHRIARLHEVELDDPTTAIEQDAAILADAAGHEPTLQALENLVRTDREARKAAGVLEPVLTAAGAWPRMIQVWRDLLTVVQDVPERVALLRRVGKAQEDMLADSQAAFAAYGEGLREDPNAGEILEDLERVAGYGGLWAELVGLLEDEVPNVSDEQAVLGFYLRSARIFEEELGSNVEAIERFRSVMEIDPDHEKAILALDRLYLKEGMWADLAEILQLEVERAEDAARIPLLLRLGALFENNLEDVHQAISAYRDVLDLQAQQPEAVQALERMFAAGMERPVIGELLEPIYTENEDWPRLHDLLHALLEHQLPGDDRMRAMHRLGELCLEKLGDESRAFDWYGAAFKEVPEDEQSHQELARLAGVTGRWPDLVVVYTEGLQKTQDLELVRSLSHEMASLYREKLEDDGAAETMYRYVLDNIDDVDTKALKGLDELYEGQQRWPELVDVLRREVDSTYEPAERTAFMFRLGQTLEGRLGQIEGAVDQYTAIIDDEPTHPGALDRLEQIYLAQQTWDPLFEIYNRKTEIAPDDEAKAELFAQMANLAAEFLERPEDAIDLWNQVLDIRGEDPHALMALEGLYQNAEAWRDLVSVCERQVNLLENDPEREIALYAKLGRVWGDYLEREENALENWHAVLERRPEDQEALWAVKGLYERTSEHPQIAKTDHRLLDLLASDDPRRIDLFRQLGQLYQEALEQPTDAISAWTNVLAIEAYDPEAIDALEELYAGAEDWASCVEILDRKAEITQDPYDKVSILFRIADMHREQLGDAAGAQSALRRVLEVQSDSLDAYEQLETLFEDGEQWEDLVNLLLGRLELTQDAFERQEAFQRIAKTFEERLGLTDNAFLVLGQAFDESRDDERFGDELERLAGETDSWTELVTLYENVLQAMGTVPESVPLHLRVASWYDTKLEQAQHAGTHYQYVLAIEPENVPALTALELLLERYQNWPKVAEVLEKKVDLMVDPDERKASLQKLAQTYENRLDRADDAIEAYRQVVQIDGGDLETLQALERLFTFRQRWEELVEVLEQQAGVITDETAIVENHLTVGELFETRLGAPERAIDAYNQALGVDDKNLDAMKALEKLYAQQDRWHELLDIYEMMLQVSPEPEAQQRILNRIAMIQEEELSDVHATIDTYEKMAVINPADGASMRALDRLYRDTERWDDLAEAYERHLAHALGDADKIAVRTALAELYRGPIADHHKAIDALKPVLEIDGNHRPTLAALGALYAEVEDWHACIDALARESHLITDRNELLDRQCQVGRIFQEKVGDLEQADRWFHSALEHDPNHLPALDALKDIYEQRGEYNEVVRIRKMMEAATRSFPEKATHLFAIGAVYDKHLGDRVTAIDFYEQAMDLDPQNVEAAQPLIEVYWEDQRWERAEPLLDLTLAKLGPQMELREQQHLHYRLGFVTEKLHKEEKALTHYRHAYELDSTHLATLQGMGELLFHREDWDRAFKIFQTMLVHHRESLAPEAIVEIFNRQGVIKLKVGERRKALDFFRKALDLEPNHRSTLERMVALHEAQGDWDDVVHYRRQLVALLEPGQEKFQGLVAIADVLHGQMRNARLAIEAYEQALEVQPTSKLVLSKLLAIHEEAGNWDQAVQVLTQLAEMEADAKRQAKYFYAVGAIQRDYLKDGFTAVRTFDKALDADPSMLKAFQAIDKVLTDARDFERQDRYYRKMLKRATEAQLDTALVIKLAKALGEINRSRLQKYDEAIKAYKIALAKNPQDTDVHGIVAQLYELEGRADKAIAEYYKLIELNPRNIESYQNLRRLFMDSQRFDEAWCVCQVLTVLGQASPDERAFYEKYRSRTLTQARRPLDKQHWALINHPQKSALLDQLFMRLYRHTVPLMVLTHKQIGVHKRRDLIDPNEQTPFNNVLGYTANITRLQRLECFKAPGGRAGVQAVNLNPPAMLIGSDLLSGRNLQELAFITAKQLYLMGQQHFLATIDDSYENRKARLQSIVYTLIKTINPQAQVPFHDENLLQHFAQIPAPELNEMAKLIQKMQANPQQHLNLSKWLEMMEHSANRLGLVLANDVKSAMQVIRNETGTFSKAPTQDRIRELVLFALSENYFQLRKALGLAIG